MTEPPHASWDNAQALLVQWHEVRRPEVARAVLGFIEIELRLILPAPVRRSWQASDVEDALQSFLTRLLEKPLPDDITNFRAYLRTTFRNHFIDLYRHRTRIRQRERSVDETELGWESFADAGASALDAVAINENAVLVQSALASLSIPDRVAIKLELVPQWLTDNEMLWLAELADSDSASVRRAIESANDTYATSRIFDPADDDPNNSVERRKRMERFRRRRSRALGQLRELLKEANR